VLDRRHPSRRNESLGGIDDVPKRKRVTDEEDPRLGPRQDQPQATCEPRGGLGTAFAAPGCRQARRLGCRPRSVVVERATFEAPEPDLVQLRYDDPRDVARRERKLQGLLRSPELAGNAEIDLLRGEDAPEPSRLLDPFRREALAGNGARGDRVLVGRRVRMADEEERLQLSALPQRSTERYQSTRCIPTAS
jgi:hypothetical protein